MNQQHSTKPVPAKYALLKQAASFGLNVPRSLLIDCANIDESEITDFLDSAADGKFILRSANLTEDGSTLSLAGHFWSSDSVEKSTVFDTLNEAAEKNQQILTALGLNDSPQLILQEYVEHTLGGVLFSPWSFFADYSYVEYSETGVKSVVEGGNSQRAIICMDEQQEDLLAPSKTLRPLLLTVCKQLKQHFDFPIDSEWAYDEQQQRIVVLQIRPQTHLIGPVLSNAPTSLLDERWQFTALSESLGRLSPLSFSLMQHLYETAKQPLQALGYQAQQLNFMHYADDGTVLVDPTLEQAFFKMTLFGGFKRGMQQSKSLEDALKVMIEYDDSATFSRDTLFKLFQHWLVANVMSAGAGRDNIGSENSTHSAHPYELMWPVQLQKPTPPCHYSWSDLNQWGRCLFLFELNKLKQQLALKSDNPYLALSTWDEYLENNLSGAQQRQHVQAKGALYDYALLSNTTANGIQALSSTKRVSSTLFIIATPSHFNAAIPNGCILVAPYFDNRWVSAIKGLKGIVINRGSQLSHSAIVAREHGVPYYVNATLNLEDLPSNQRVTLDAGQLSE